MKTRGKKQNYPMRAMEPSDDSDSKSHVTQHTLVSISILIRGGRTGRTAVFPRLRLSRSEWALQHAERTSRTNRGVAVGLDVDDDCAAIVGSALGSAI